MKNSLYDFLRRLTGVLLSVLLLLAPVSVLAEDSPDQTAALSPAAQEEEALPEAAPSPKPELAALAADSSLLRTGDHEPYLSGYQGRRFQPDKNMSRAEAAQMLYSLLREPMQGAGGRFSDVRDGAWYAPAVNALAQLGVLSGYRDGTFQPNGSVTRAAFVTMVVQCFRLPEGAAFFNDVPSTHWAYSGITAAASQGWISGVGGGLFQPNRAIRRSEAVTVMNLALGRTDDGFAAQRDTQLFVDVPPTHWAYLQVTEAARPVGDPAPTPTPTPTPVSGFAAGDQVTVTAASGLRLRSSPSTATDDNILLTLNYGARLTVTGVTGAWLAVRDSSGRNGYVHSDYVVKYTPGAATGARLSASEVTLHQYQSVRVDASITSGDLGSMRWSSSDPGVADLGYIVEMGESRSYAAMLYARAPGTAVLTFTDGPGSTSASVTVTVTAPEPIRFAYSSENAPAVGQTVDLIAITDPTQSEVTFTVDGNAYPTELYTPESRSSSYGLPDNQNRVFRRPVTFTRPGAYEITAATAGGSKTFSLTVQPASGGPTVTGFDARMTSTRELRLIAAYEGSIPEVEDDSIASGNPTVGYGYVVRENVTFYNNLTPSELFGMLTDKVNNEGFAAVVNRFRANNNLKMSQAQFDALVSFVYNCGSGPLGSDSTAAQVMLNAVAPPQDLSESKPVSGVLNIDDGFLYESPSVSAGEVIYVPEGAGVTVIGVQVLREKAQVWYLARYSGKTGYLPAGLVQLNTSGLVHDLAYADATILANNILQWNMSAGEHWAGLVYRRLAECKVFFFADYAQADPNNDWDLYRHNTYGFIYPSSISEYER